MQQQQGKPRRRILIVDKDFQLRFSLFVSVWVFVLSLVYPYIIYLAYDDFAARARQQGWISSAVKMQELQGEVLTLIVILQAIFIGLTLIFSVFVSHRIAGPLYKLRLFFKKAKEGNLEGDMYFRKKDYFKYIAAEYNEMVSAIKARQGGGASAPDLSPTVSKLQAFEGQISDEKSRNEFNQALAELKKVSENAPQ